MDIKAGLGYEATFTVTGEKEQVGIYICGDGNKSGTCRNKKKETFQAITTQLADRKPEAKAPDFVYYFQYLMLDGSELEAISGNKFKNEHFGKVEDYLKQKGVDRKHIKEVQATQQAIQSVPLRLAKNTVFIRLPHNDPRCMNEENL